MNQKVFGWIAQCTVCQTVGHNDETRMGMGKIPLVAEVFACLEVDILVPLENSRAGHKFLLVTVD